MSIKKILICGAVPFALSVSLNGAVYAGGDENAAENTLPPPTYSFGIQGVVDADAIIPSTAAAAALSDQVTALQGAYTKLMSVIQTSVDRQAAGTHRVSIDQDGDPATTGDAGFRTDLMAEGIFTDAEFEEAKVLIDGSIYLKTAPTFLAPLAQKEIILLAHWGDDDDVANPGAEDGPDGPIFSGGFFCLTNVLPSPLPFDGAGNAITDPAALIGHTVQDISTMMFSTCAHADSTTIADQKAKHDNDALATDGGYCSTVFTNEVAVCPQ